MPREQKICNGNIIEYYDDGSDWTSYECVGCGHITQNGSLGGANWNDIEHTKNCTVVKKGNKERKEAEKINAIVTAAFAKLTKKEIFALEKYYD